jgi:hypothetical protein
MFTPMKIPPTAILTGLFVFASLADSAAQGAGPCGLLTSTEVQAAIPGARSGRSDKDQKLGLLRCVWDTPTGTLMLIEGTGPPEDLPKDEAQSWMDAFLDPLRANAGRNVRYEPLPGVGEVAVAVVEKADPARGIARDGAVLVVKRGKRQVSLLSTDLARRDRAEGLRVLTQLGKAIASRLN